uniref:Uncharacterized protein n=1 Tax=Arundo donax TaxID=35708 RepID=A0A0A9DD80_ARUDO
MRHSPPGDGADGQLSSTERGSSAGCWCWRPHAHEAAAAWSHVCGSKAAAARANPMGPGFCIVAVATARDGALRFV